MKVYEHDLRYVDVMNHPEGGEIYVCPDAQRRSRPGSWIVAIMGDGTLEGDTVQLGIFWRKNLAELFASAYENAPVEIKK